MSDFRIDSSIRIVAEFTRPMIDDFLQPQDDFQIQHLR